MFSRRVFGKIAGAAAAAPFFPLVARGATPPAPLPKLELKGQYAFFEPPLVAHFYSPTGSELASARPT
jgi:hypothetical protein